MRWQLKRTISSVTFSWVLVSILSSTTNAANTDRAFNSVPSRFRSDELSVGSRGLGEICLSRNIMPDGTVCNPAYLHQVKDSTVLAKVFIGNGYTALSTANKLLFSSVSKEFLRDLFQKNNVTSLEASVGLSFTTRHFSADFSPYRVQYVSEVHNPNFPVLAIHAAVERRIGFSAGTSLASLGEDLKSFSVGARLKLLEREFVHKSFSLFELAAEPDAKKLIPVQKQKAVFVDPFLGFSPEHEEGEWGYNATIGARNLGKAWPESPLYPEREDFEAGFGVEPPVGFGVLKLGIDFVDILHAECDLCRVRGGASYRFGMLEMMTGANSNTFSAGVQFSLQVFKGGVVYEFVRDDLTGKEMENRVATEVGIAL